MRVRRYGMALALGVSVWCALSVGGCKGQGANGSAGPDGAQGAAKQPDLAKKAAVLEAAGQQKKWVAGKGGGTKAPASSAGTID